MPFFVAHLLPDNALWINGSRSCCEPEGTEADRSQSRGRDSLRSNKSRPPAQQPKDTAAGTQRRIHSSDGSAESRNHPSHAHRVYNKPAGRQPTSPAPPHFVLPRRRQEAFPPES